MSADAKRTLKLGYEDYKCFPDDGRRHEIIDGDHYVNPAPNLYHQRLLRRILVQLDAQVEPSGLAEVFCAPTDLQLSDHDIVQPDLIVVRRERHEICTPTRIKGTPDLVVEILSDSTASIDRFLKKNVYCHSQVPEYWIVDPEQHVVEQFVLRGAEYELVGQQRDRITLTILPGVAVNLTKVW